MVTEYCATLLDKALAKWHPFVDLHGGVGCAHCVKETICSAKQTSEVLWAAQGDMSHLDAFNPDYIKDQYKALYNASYILHNSGLPNSNVMLQESWDLTGIV